MSSTTERKLAAIMFTDIAGYTALSSKNEQRALEILDTQEKILKPIIEQHNGILHKQIGDGLLFTFPTVSDSIKCGIKIQKETKNIKDLNLRIGIHEGEITIRDGDALGDDVNIASRIESYAAEGGIAISGKVQQNISSIPEFKTKFISQPKLKGVKQDVKIYCLIQHNLPETDITKVTAKLECDVKTLWSNQKFIISAIFLLAATLGIYFFSSNDQVLIEAEEMSIAVIPFVNKGTAEDSFYSYGISNDINEHIINVGSFKVESVNNIEKLDLDDLSNKEICKALSVRYLLQGSLWKKGDVFQLSIELYDADSDNVVLTDRFEKDWEVLSEIQFTTINKVFTYFNLESNESYYVSNPEAYEYYLKGHDKYFFRETPEDLEMAISMFEKSIESDNEMTSSYILLGWIYYREKGDFDKALEYYTKGNTLAKKYNLKSKVGWSTLYLGDIKHSKDDNIDKAINYWNDALDIFNSINDDWGKFAVYRNLALTYFYKKYNIEKADFYFQKCLEMHESFEISDRHPQSTYTIADFYFQRGMLNKSIELFDQCIDLSKNNDSATYLSNCSYSRGEMSILISEYPEAIKFFSVSDSINKKLYAGHDLLEEFSVYLNEIIKLCENKMFPDIKEINIDNKVLDSISDDYESLYLFYALTQDEDYLKKAYIELNNFIDTLNPKQISGFKSLYYPKMILGQYDIINK